MQILSSLGDPTLLLSPSSVIPKAWKRHIGEERVIQVIERADSQRVRLITCYFHPKNQAMESLDLAYEPPNMFLRDSELYSIDIKCKIIELLFYAPLKISLFKELCCEGLSNLTSSFLR